jgi:chitinase
MRRSIAILCALLFAAACPACAGCVGSVGPAGQPPGGDDDGVTPTADARPSDPDADPAAPDAAPAPPGDDTPPPPLPAHTVAIYWGQNGYGGAHPADPSRWEPALIDVCADPAYDIVILSFMTSFVSQRNADHLPELNFAFHCDTPYDAANPFLLRCPDIEAGIKACHAAGKHVLISMGGAAGGYGFASDAEAESFAQTAWDMFLGGAGAVRPFGAAVLDGVDLDIEGGSSVGYGAFAARLRQIADARGAGRHFMITAAPQCPFPDAYLGPSPGRALGDHAAAFDALFVQFYNNYCAYPNGAPFADAWNQWSGVGGPKIYVGLPATTEAAAAASYVPAANLPALVGAVKNSPSFGGLMLWDASFDRQSGAPGQTYGAAAAAALP